MYQLQNLKDIHNQQQDEAIKQNERDIKVLQNTVQSLQKQLEKYEKKAMADVILD